MTCESNQNPACGISGWHLPSNCRASAEERLEAKKAKLQYHLMPTAAERLVIEVLQFGAEKHGEGDWRNVARPEEVLLDAARRHVAARLGGEVLDPESRKPHLAHAAATLILWLEIDQAPAAPVVGSAHRMPKRSG